MTDKLGCSNNGISGLLLLMTINKWWVWDRSLFSRESIVRKHKEN